MRNRAKSANRISIAGRRPHQRHARNAAPVNPSSAIGVFITRRAPNSASSPLVTFEGAAEFAGDVFAEDEHARIATHLLAERLADGSDVGEPRARSPAPSTPAKPKVDTLVPVRGIAANHSAGIDGHAAVLRIGRTRGGTARVPHPEALSGLEINLAGMLGLRHFRLGLGGRRLGRGEPQRRPAALSPDGGGPAAADPDPRGRRVGRSDRPVRGEAAARRVLGRAKNDTLTLPVAHRFGRGSPGAHAA